MPLAELLLDRLDHLPQAGHHVVNLIDVLPRQDSPGAQPHRIGIFMRIVLHPLTRHHIFLVLSGENFDVNLDGLFEVKFLILLQFIVSFLHKLLQLLLMRGAGLIVEIVAILCGRKVVVF